MRWNDLFGDLEGQLAAAHSAEFEAEVAELAAAERASVELAARLLAARGAAVTVRLVGGTAVRGMVADATPSWLLLQDGAREHLIPAHAIAAVEGLADRSLPLGDVERRLTLGHALRLVASEGSRVIVESAVGEHRGRVVAVGADHCDVVADDGRGTVALPFAAIRRVTSA